MRLRFFRRNARKPEAGGGPKNLPMTDRFRPSAPEQVAARLEKRKNKLQKLQDKKERLAHKNAENSDILIAANLLTNVLGVLAISLTACIVCGNKDNMPVLPRLGALSAVGGAWAAIKGLIYVAERAYAKIIERAEKRFDKKIEELRNETPINKA